jgi:hypothetical protein
MPDAISMSYAVFEPFSKDLVGGSSYRSDYGYPSGVVFLLSNIRLHLPGREIPAEQFEKPSHGPALGPIPISCRAFPPIKFGAAVLRIEATR